MSAEDKLVCSGEVYSWFGQLHQGDCWKPCWLTLSEEGWLKWYAERRGHIDGVAHLPVIAEKIGLEPRTDYLVGKVKGQVNAPQEILDGLCEVVIVVRCRVKNKEERVAFAFETQQKLDKWLNAFLSVLHSSKVQWNDSNLESYPDTWQTLQQYFCIDNFPEADLTACCGVSDVKLDEMIRQDKATDSRDEMVPRSLPKSEEKKLHKQGSQLSSSSAVNAGGGGGTAGPENAGGVYKDMMAMGWPS